MIKEIEKTCENCEYEYEDMEGTHCRHCIHNATENFKPKTDNVTVKKIREDAIKEFAERMEWEYDNAISIPKVEIDFAKEVIERVAEQMKAGAI